MKSTQFILMLLCIVCLQLVFSGYLVKYLIDYLDDIKRVKSRMQKDCNQSERISLRKELRVYYWCIIPGITPSRVEYIRYLLYSNNCDAKQERHNGRLGVILFPSFLGICICSVCLAGSTFAWFTASQSTATQVIQTANYSIKAVVKDGNDAEIAANNKVYKLKAGNTYEVVLTADGNASTGYCILRFGDEELSSGIYTQQFPSKKYKNNTITFSLVVNESVDMKIIPQWGTASTDEKRLESGGKYTYGEAVESIMNDVSDETDEEEKKTDKPDKADEVIEQDVSKHIVQSGETLWDIAQKYSTSVDKLVEFNSLSDSRSIWAGQIIRIPPAKLPSAKPTETEEPTDEVKSTPEPAATETPVVTEEPKVTLTFENCTFEAGAVYAAHFDSGAGTITFKNCKLSGWSSFGRTFDKVVFENCTFDEALKDNSWGLLRFYCDGVIKDCTFLSGFDRIDNAVAGITITIDGGTGYEGKMFCNGDPATLGATWIVNGQDISNTIE